MRALRERFRSIVAEIPSVPGADLVLRDLIRRWSSNGFVSSASVTCGWGRQKYLLTERFTTCAWLAVLTIKLRWWFHSKCCVRRLALSAKLKTYTLWPNKGGTDCVGVVKYLAIFQNDFAWTCSVPRKEDHLEFCSWVSWEVRIQGRSWWRRWKRRNPDLDTAVSNRFWVSWGWPDLGGKVRRWHRTVSWGMAVNATWRTAEDKSWIVCSRSVQSLIWGLLMINWSSVEWKSNHLACVQPRIWRD